MQPKKACKWCGEYPARHFNFQCRKNPKAKRTINQISTKQAEYHIWLEQVARPYLIAKWGNVCQRCFRTPREAEKLDIDHILAVGSHPQLKKDLNNMQLLCRACHRLKTDNKW